MRHRHKQTMQRVKKKQQLNSPDTEQEDKMSSSTVLENMAGF